MSIARHHTEWLSLVPVSGPFLSLPVLMDAFNTGLEPHDPDHMRGLRQQYADWQEAQEKRKGDPTPRQQWIRWVLSQTLDYDDKVLVEGQAIPQTLQVEVAEHHELLRPDFVLNDSVTGKPRLLIQTYPRSQELTSYLIGSRWKASPDTRMTELLHATGVRLGLVTNGEHWMLVNAPKGETSGYASWYAGLWQEEPITLRAFRSLLGLERFNAEADKTLESLLEKSASNQQEVTDQLGYQVRKAVEVLIHSLDRADQDFERSLLADVPEEVLYESALTTMMRLVFLFCAEERELIPSKPFPVYEQNYSVSTISKQLRELADQHGEELLERRYDAWPRLLAAYRAVYGGLKHDDVHIPAYGGNLFNPDRFPFLEGRKPKTKWQETDAAPLPVNNRTALHLLEALQLLQLKVPGSKQAEARRISFRALDIEQIGHVYEGLLDHTAKRATEPYLGLAGSKDKEPEITLSELEKQAAKGEPELVKFLKEETGKSEAAIKKLLDAEPDAQDAARLRSACQNDDKLLDRVKAFAGLVRDDTFGYPVVLPKGCVFVTAGTDRRSSGTHYTPRSLTEPIVQYTLEPLVYVGPAEGLPKDQWKLKSAKELLSLKICDMACGSGAFLVQVCRYMATRLLEAWDAAQQTDSKAVHITPEGEPSTGKPGEMLIPDDHNERYTYALRIVAQRCIYGVDKNPLAVEMAKLSLWLLTLAKDKPFEFLDHSIRCGDSLVGIHSLDQLRHFSLKPDSKDPVLFKGPLDEMVDEAVALRLKLEDMSANSVEDVKRQEELLADAKNKMAMLRCAADILVAAEFWGETAKDKQERVRHALAVTEKHLAAGTLEAFEQETEKERRGQAMFHWPLEFPEVIVKRGGFDGFVGNPPFMGGAKLATEIGVQYRDFIVPFVASGIKGKRGQADLSAYFLRRLFVLSASAGCAGVVTTNTIAQGDTRILGLEDLVASGYTILRAISTQTWPGAASLEISLLWLKRGGWHASAVLDGCSTQRITPYLCHAGAVEGPPQELTENSGRSFKGPGVEGTGFVLTPETAERLLRESDANRDVLFLYLRGEDFNSRPDQTPAFWVINFHDWPLDRSTAPAGYRGPVATDYPACFEIVERLVKPQRQALPPINPMNVSAAKKWWQYREIRPLLMKALRGMERVLFHSFTSRHVAFAFVPSSYVFAAPHNVFILDRYHHFACLQSSFHVEWAWANGSTLRTDLRYTRSTCFETFPMPKNSDVLEDIGREYYEQRAALMQEEGKGLTSLYNAFNDPSTRAAPLEPLRSLLTTLDTEVAAAYDWDDLNLGHGFHETKQGIRFTISEAARREVLQRLLKLNHERYAEEVKQGLHDKKKGAAKKPKAEKAPATTKTSKNLSLDFDTEGDDE
jgi:hypothetical protein